MLLLPIPQLSGEPPPDRILLLLLRGVPGEYRLLLPLLVASTAGFFLDGDDAPPAVDFLVGDGVEYGDLAAGTASLLLLKIGFGGDARSISNLPPADAALWPAALFLNAADAADAAETSQVGLLGMQSLAVAVL